MLDGVSPRQSLVETFGRALFQRDVDKRAQSFVALTLRNPRGGEFVIRNMRDEWHVPTIRSPLDLSERSQATRRAIGDLVRLAPVVEKRVDTWLTEVAAPVWFSTVTVRSAARECSRTSETPSSLRTLPSPVPPRAAPSAHSKLSDGSFYAQLGGSPPRFHFYRHPGRFAAEFDAELERPQRA